ncbi:cytochrome P450 [Kitasatospora sp. NPDC059673]|uniref:cytochrome P450 n=1 Tax=Kitasatospora sp. NPDC059673 TaxID=3346901 RepID=UPI003680EA2D
MARYSRVMQAEIEFATGGWQPGKVIDAFPTFHGIALRTLGRTLCATAIDAELARSVEQAFDTVLNGVFRQMFLPAQVRKLPLPGILRYRRALSHLRDATRQLIATYRSHLPQPNPTAPPDPTAPARPHRAAPHPRRRPTPTAPPHTLGAGPDLLTALLAAHDDGARLTDTEVHDQVITLLAAGTETVAATLTWALWWLSQHPAAAEQVRAELAEVLPDGRAPGWADLPHLGSVDRVVSETLRLHPPGWLFTRVTTAPTDLAGRTLPAGTTLVFSPAAVSRHPAAYLAPAQFDPDRWRPERVTRAARRAFLPFGTGARKCVGDLFARTERVLVLAPCSPAGASSRSRTPTCGPSRWPPCCARAACTCGSPRTDGHRHDRQLAPEPRRLPPNPRCPHRQVDPGALTTTGTTVNSPPHDARYRRIRAVPTAKSIPVH